MKPAIWTAMDCEQPLAEALLTLSGCGWKAFEVGTEHLEQIEASRHGGRLIAAACRVAQRRRLALPQAHAYLPANLAHPEPAVRREHLRRLIRHCEIAARLGVKTLVVHPGYDPRAEWHRVLALNAAGFRPLGDCAAGLGLRIAIENFSERRLATAADLRKLLGAIRHPALGICLDTSHAHVARVAIPAMIRELGGRLIATHISDNDGSGDQHKTPGGGTIAWPAVMAAFRDIRYHGLFNLEIPGARHPVPELRRLETVHAFQVTEWLLGLAR